MTKTLTVIKAIRAALLLTLGLACGGQPTQQYGSTNATPTATTAPVAISQPAPTPPEYNFGSGGSATATPRATPYDPVNDRSEEGIRMNIADVNKSVTYEHLKKNADRYHGEPWAFTGRIFQIQESGDQTTALVSLDAWGNKLMWVRAGFTTEFVEKNQVYVVGYLAGNYSYTSVAGWEVTVPAMDARAILKPAEVARIRAGKTVGKK